MIEVRLDLLMAQRKVTLTALAEKSGLSARSLSHLRQRRAKAIQFRTLETLCMVFQCQPGYLLVRLADGKEKEQASKETT